MILAPLDQFHVRGLAATKELYFEPQALLEKLGIAHGLGH
jgi:hypothetical protein